MIKTIKATSQAATPVSATKLTYHTRDVLENIETPMCLDRRTKSM